MNQIFHDDCLNILRDLPDNSIDAIVTDPPYLTTDLKMDKEGFNVNEFKKECLRIIKENGYFISFGSIELLGNFAQDFPLRYSGVWLKSSSVMRTASAKKPMSKAEIYGVFAHPKHKIAEITFNKLKIEGSPYKKIQKKRGYKRGGKDSLARADTSGWTEDGYISINEGFRWQTDVIEAPNKTCMKHSERTDHPTQKPIKLISTLLQMLTKEGDLIVDPFAGSFTTAISCLELNRKYICIEKDQEYFEIGKNRIAKWHEDNKQKDLFSCEKN